MHLPKGGRQATVSKCCSQMWRPFSQATRPFQRSQAVGMGGYISRRRHGDANAERKKRAAEQQKPNEGLWGGQVVKDAEPKPKLPRFQGGRKRWPTPRASREIPRGHALRTGRPENRGLKKSAVRRTGRKACMKPSIPKASKNLKTPSPGHVASKPGKSISGRP